MQPQLQALYRTGSRVSIDSITSFARHIATIKAYTKFLENLYQIEVTAEMEWQNEINSQNTATSGQTDESNTDHSQLSAVSGFRCSHLYLLIDIY